MSKDHKHPQEDAGSKFINGLLAGAALGAGAFMLFGTKKGKEIVKKVKEQSREKLSTLQELFEETAAEQDDAATESLPTPEEKPKKIAHKKTNGSTVQTISEHAKRFFNGPTKKSS